MAILVALLLAIYFTPSLVAVCRNHRRTAKIVITNIFLGWTVISWVGALAWAARPKNHGNGLSRARYAAKG